MTTIIINGESYDSIDKNLYDTCPDIFSLVHSLKNNEYMNYYDKYIYRNTAGVFACYVEDTTNFWKI